MLNANATKLINSITNLNTVTSTVVRNASAGVLSTYIAEEMDAINGQNFQWDPATVIVMVANCQLAHPEL
jgi:hypothetical protein